MRLGCFQAMIAEIDNLLVKNREAAAAAAQAAQAAQNRSSTTTAEEERAELEGVAEIDADSEEYEHDEM